MRDKKLARRAAKGLHGVLKLLKGSSSKESPYKSNYSTKEKQKASTSNKTEKVRVWWPPTTDKQRTGFSGAYWPATLVQRGTTSFHVRYDNGDVEKVHVDNVFPASLPVDFGKEATPLEVGEFVEVHNGSKTDPCAWLGMVAGATSDKEYTVTYPFHDSEEPDDVVKASLIRRARVWDGDAWRVIEPFQTWEGGEVTSPKELALVAEGKPYRVLLKAKAGTLAVAHVGHKAKLADVGQWPDTPAAATGGPAKKAKAVPKGHASLKAKEVPRAKLQPKEQDAPHAKAAPGPAVKSSKHAAAKGAGEAADAAERGHKGKAAQAAAPKAPPDSTKRRGTLPKAAAGGADAEPSSKKRGRPTEADAEPELGPRKRGRPAKLLDGAAADGPASKERGQPQAAEAATAAPSAAKKPGRPAKVVVAAVDAPAPAVKRKPGRPAKVVEAAEAPEAAALVVKKRPGRPAKVVAAAHDSKESKRAEVREAAKDEQQASSSSGAAKRGGKAAPSMAAATNKAAAQPQPATRKRTATPAAAAGGR